MEYPVLSYESLRSAVSGTTAAIRRVTKLFPAGGSEKVFPPTYEGAEYAVESRKVRSSDGTLQTMPTVLLDSVQSQANRLELALLRGYRAGKLRFPMMWTDFAAGEENPWLCGLGRITALEAPHRLADAIFRDSQLEGVPFRESTVGKSLDDARTTNATPVFRLCPSALVFGFWDSTGPRGGLGAKVQRALVSEIVGFDVTAGVRPSSRIDPLQIEREGITVYEKPDGGWTLDPAAAKTKDGKAVKFGKDGKPSEINHGNITPSLRDKNGNPNHGGFTLAYAEQTTVLSIAALRKLQFPLQSPTRADQGETDDAARTVLAALGLAAVCFLDQEGYDLRSRCLLDGKPGTFELLDRGRAQPFGLDADASARLLEEASQRAAALGLPWWLEPITLTPSQELKQLVLKSREKSVAVPAE